MELKEFLERVLPVQGTDYFGAALSDTGKLHQTKLPSIDALEKYIRNNHRRDVYFATGTYLGQRTQKQTESKKSFYVDIDVGVDPNKYPDKKTAVRALYDFCKESFLPPSILVDSGGGIHAYWTLTKACGPARWKPIAEALRDKCVEAGLLADHPITGDSARILRSPGSINFKRDKPREVRILASGDDYAVEDISNALSAVQPALSLVATLGAEASDLSDGVQFIERTNYARYIVKNCPMFADAMATGGKGLSNALWTQQLHVLAYCEDGEEFAYKVSEGYAGFSAAETRMKWNQKLARKDKAGPTLCKTFSKLSDKCATCPFFESISTPLQLGVDRDFTMPFPYQQDEKGVYYVSKTTDKVDFTTSLERVDVVDFNIENVAIAHEVSHPMVIQFKAIVKNQEYRVELNTGGDLHRREVFVQVLSEAGVAVDRFEVDKLRDLLMAWAKHIQRYKQVQRYASQLGWVTNPLGFALAEEVVYENERVKNNVYENKQLASMFIPVGLAQPWLDVSLTLTRQNRHSITAAILTAFAAPLSRFLSSPSAVLAFVSAKSGSGKTTALHVAQAVWGNPREAMNQLDDTQNAIFKKMGYLNSLPAYWDEVRAKEDVGKFLRLIFQLTGGKERSRLTQQTDMREARTWNTILTVASNESIADHATQASPDSEAGRVRVFEVVVPAIDEESSQPEIINQLMLGVYSNYGVIGSEYAQYLVENHKQVEALVNKVHEQLRVKLLKDPSERFWLCSVTVLVAAAHIANKLGYVDIDINKFIAWVCRQFRLQQQDQQSEYASEAERSSSIVMDFVSEMRSQVMVYEHQVILGRFTNGKIYARPQFGEIVAGLAIKDGVLRVNKKVFRDWIYTNKLGTPKMVMKELSYKEFRGMIDGDTEIGKVTKIRCYDIKLEDSLIADLSDAYEGLEQDGVKNAGK